MRVGKRSGRRLAPGLVGGLLLLGAVVGPASQPVSAQTPLPQTLEAWIYPSSSGQPACDTSSELAALTASPVSILKPEYLDVNGTGRVVEETAAELPCNGFSSANLAQARAAAQQVYVTVSSGNVTTKALLDKASRSGAAQSAIESFVAANGLNGVDLDFEPNKWSTALWDSYMSFVSGIAAALSPADRGVEVDLDPFVTTPWDAERYADVPAAGAHLVVMAYDDEYNSPCAPISPFSWLQAVVSYAQSQVPSADLTIGIPSYGYYTTTCKRIGHVTDNVAYTTMETEPGFPTAATAVAALRDPNSGEIRWSSGRTFYDYVDATSLNEKLQIVENVGVTDVSVWSLGGQPWFTGNPDP